MSQSMIGTKSMVVSPHYLASAAGCRILQKGGNAFDAAVAASACLAVVYPHMTGIGGDSFWLFYSKKDQAVRAYNGSGRSGYNATPEKYEGLPAIPYRGIQSVITVPGMVDSWDAIIKEYGRLSLAEVLEPAIEYAENGFPFSKDQYVNTQKNVQILREFPETSSIFLPHHRIPSINEKFIQKQLADTLKELANKGRDHFYKGSLTKRIVSSLREKGGILIEDDFADHHGDWVEPLSGTYRGYTMYQVPPNSQGFAGLMALNILENFDFKTIPHGSFQYYHLLTESLKKSFQDRNKVLTDPEFYQIPLDKLLSKTYAKKLAESISLTKASEVKTQPVGNDTAHAAVVDEEGNAVSFIQSLYFEFGSCVVAGDTGILMQNRGSFFSLDRSHVNCLAPRKRTFHTLMPAMAFKDGKPYILYGTQGGEGQPQTQTAIITRMIDYRMSPAEAIYEPRFVWGRTWGEETEELKMEGRISKEVIESMIKAGHLVKVVEPIDKIMGHANAILIDEQSFLHGGVDPRGDGAAIGW
ncbi:MAG: gamma-glutamyltransferase [Bacillaceae bacterium]|uniref:gamma-glutamyltransferase n=1 Tax=Aeribacillus TaxID=1055323 RepID=UPI000E3AB045|nr:MULTISPECIES: gamma-glutamyltransferase [Aeribacillus]MED1441451.1 gamma-glutamyltransferase [Aeribacillus composti]REJ13448.1 MAG: gamma-glutamyltransferase [Bacillaceae bacterium]RZI51082.1 gamma-glutamyltransferase [Aeribacillus pallidus]